MGKSMKLVLLFLSFSFFNSVSSQEKFSLSGTISDSNTNETLIGVTVIIEELKTGTTTNEYGFYSITLPKGNYTVRYTYIGFQDIVEQINLTENIRKNVSLKETDYQLDEIIVSENIEKPNIEKPEMSVNKISSN